MRTFDLFGMWKVLLCRFWQYIIIALLCVALLYTHRESVKYNKRSDMLETTINDLNQEIRRTQIRLNDSISVYQAEVSSLNMTHDNLRAKYDKLLKSSRLKPKDVQSVVEVTSVISNTDTVVAMVDSFGGIKAKMEDLFVRIDVEVTSQRNTIIDYKIRDSLTILNVQKRHSILFGLIRWKKRKAVRVINHNPKANIVSLQTIDIIE